MGYLMVSAINKIILSFFKLVLLTFIVPQIALANDSFASQKALHNNNVGRLMFTTSPGNISADSRQGIISSIDLNSSKNLYFTAFLAKPLSNYLVDLAPELSLEAVTKKGNFQFSFFVDDELTYTENLNFGAGSFSQKSNDTVLHRPLYSEHNEDSWGRFLWMRFMHFGGEEALNEGRYELRIEIRPYIKLNKIKTGQLLAQGSIEINVIKPMVSAEQIEIQPIQSDSGWTVSQDSFNQTKIQAMNKRIAQNDFKMINGIVVIKNGELLIEQYYNGASRQTLHNQRSVGKSFASTILGIAIEDGFIKSKTSQLSDFYDLKAFDHFSPYKAQVTLKDLVTMSSGFQANDSDADSIGNEENMYPTDDWVRFTLDLPMASKQPNNKWQYFTAGVVVLGDILHQSVPSGLQEYSHEKLFKPLGITDYQWQYTPQNVANTAGGIQLRALDFAKYGQLYKNRGIWDGVQILPAEWVDASLAKQVQRGHDSLSGHYGYLFWVDELDIKGKTYEVAYATGNGGNKIFIFKEIPFVVVITASAYGKPYAHSQVNQMMGKYILPAILE